MLMQRSVPLWRGDASVALARIDPGAGMGIPCRAHRAGAVKSVRWFDAAAGRFAAVDARIGYAFGFCATLIMKPQVICQFSTAETAPSLDHPRVDRRVDGNPLRTTWEHYARQGLSSGVWACEIGSWHIRFADDRDEFFCVIEGRVRLHDELGAIAEFGPGEAGVIPAGFSGRFEVVEPVRKYFVVVDQPRGGAAV
ncbi:cupin domain-containing protein [Jeongeupia wiesaeckerbachi]|uniref:cupin domain-containing protein n=1 Tax=Jeongeupia wiesaeckerbachi TaxID=3051218 RepID=UPI003D807F73